MNVMFVFPHVVRGGIETLITRLAKYYRKKGNNVSLCCIDILDDIKNDLNKNGIEIIYYDELMDEKLASMDLIISAHFDDYLNYFCYSLNHKVKYKNILYILHPHDLSKIEFTSHKIFNLIGYEAYKKFTKYMYDCGELIFMDEMCFRDSNKELSFTNKGVEYVPLPYEFEEIDKELIQSKIESRKKEFNILTVSRADYPFKGYHKGLIKIFDKLNKSYPNIRLKIITSYDGVGQENCMDELKRWIKETGNSNITLIEGLDYAHLLEEYKKSHLYVGMGTTLIEASSNINIAIAVESYTYECKCKGTFDKEVDWLVADWGKGNEAISTIKEIIEMKDEEYKRSVEITYFKAKEMYDIQNVAQKILNMINQPLYPKNMKNCGKFLMWEHKIFLFVRKIKKIKDNSCNNEFH